MIGARYCLDERLGEGGMGAVFRAVDLTLRREVAIKVALAEDPRERRRKLERFLREARIAAAVSHPNIAATIDFGVHDGVVFMVMELLEGLTMAEQRDVAPLALPELLDVVLQTLRGLAAVHRAGIIHRDLKPENIFLCDDADGTIVKVLDFGVSRIDRPDDLASWTRDGCVAGTPYYMSPEQARGLPTIDHRSDLYALGVVLYEALSGHLPYEDEAIGDLMRRIVHGGAPPLLEVAPEAGLALSELVTRAMALDRETRFGSAGEMAAALVAAAAQTIDPMTGEPVVLPHGAWRAARPPEPRATDDQDGRDVGSRDSLIRTPITADVAGDLPAAPPGPEATPTASTSLELPPWPVDAVAIARAEAEAAEAATLTQRHHAAARRAVGAVLAAGAVAVALAAGAPARPEELPPEDPVAGSVPDELSGPEVLAAPAALTVPVAEAFFVPEPEELAPDVPLIAGDPPYGERPPAPPPAPVDRAETARAPRREGPRSPPVAIRELDY
jgi:serine/threonine-protein kinase